MIAIIIWLIIIVVASVIAFNIIDKGMTGPAAEWAWIAKLVVVLIALVALYTVFVHGGTNLLI